MNKNIVITGGSSGIGLSLSTTLLDMGHNVFILSRQSKNIGNNRPNCYEISCDVTSLNSIKNAKKEILMTLKSLDNKGIDVLINCAGVGYEKSLSESTEKDYNYIFDTNVKGLIFVTKELLELITKNYSLICNISSIAGIKGFSGWTIYSASKFAVEGFTESLRHELRSRNIKVTAVRLGSVDTNFYKDLPTNQKTEFMSPDDVAKIITNNLFTDKNSVIENIFINNSAGDI
jgi:short-subunit dehydrogenase